MYTPFATTRTTSLALGSLCASLFAAAAPIPADAQDITDDWQFAATLYLWLPDIGGHSTFPAGDGSDVGIDAEAILDELKMVGMGSFSVQKERWGGYTDLLYLDLGGSKARTRNLSIRGEPLPASVTAATDFDLKSTIWTLGGSYRFVATPGATFDVLVGARLADFNQSLDWEFTGDFATTAPPPRTGSRDTSVSQWDAIVGIKGRFAFGADSKWVVPYYFDIGTGDSDLTWQGMLGLGYAFGWGDISVAWRYLDYDLQSGSRITDVSFNGPALGATFRW